MKLFRKTVALIVFVCLGITGALMGNTRQVNLQSKTAFSASQIAGTVTRSLAGTNSIAAISSSETSGVSVRKSEKDSIHVDSAPSRSAWYEKINLRGYVQFRYNRLLETNSRLKCDQCDKSWGGTGGFSLRRARLVFFGQISERVYFYIQPDFASSFQDNNNIGQLRDAYFDLGLDKKNEYRLRLGQSKIPFGFENMQSSQNRLPLDRNDGLNSSISNERDMGIMFYWAPTAIRERFAHLVSAGLKGSGDYGVFAFGVFNGQTANRTELNDEPHVVARLTYPFRLKSGQFLEPSVQFYSGKYVVPTVSDGVGGRENFQYDDQRAALSLVLYPQPFGIQAEYNIGTGPEFDPASSSIKQKHLNGGYITTSYMVKAGGHTIIPFVRLHHYNGGKKFETDARRYNVKELEIGAEWQPFKNFELVGQYTISDRLAEDAGNPDNQESGNLLRLQAQLNF